MKEGVVLYILATVVALVCPAGVLNMRGAVAELGHDPSTIGQQDPARLPAESTSYGSATHQSLTPMECHGPAVQGGACQSQA